MWRKTIKERSYPLLVVAHTLLFFVAFIDLCVLISLNFFTYDLEAPSAFHSFIFSLFLSYSPILMAPSVSAIGLRQSMKF